METETVTDPIMCPHCGKEIGLEIKSKLMSDSRMSFTLHPHEGEFLSAGTVGGTITDMEKLLVAVGKQLGAKTQIVIEGLSYNNGSIKVDLLLTRLELGIGKRKAA